MVEFNDPMEGQVKERDYQPKDGCNLSSENEVEMESSNKGFNNKNYNFNNCNITIYEEGKAIEILQNQEKQKAKMQEAQVKIIGDVMTTVTNTITSLLELKSKRVREGMAENTGEPVTTNPKKPTRKRPSSKKKASAKKVATKVGKK